MQPALWPWFDQWIFREEVFSQGSNIWRRREHLNDLCIDAKGLFYQQCHESGNGTYRSWETGLKTFVTEMSSGGSDKKAPLDQQVRWLSCQPRHHDHHQGNDGNAGNLPKWRSLQLPSWSRFRSRSRSRSMSRFRSGSRSRSRWRQWGTFYDLLSTLISSIAYRVSSWRTTRFKK